MVQLSQQVFPMQQFPEVSVNVMFLIAFAATGAGKPGVRSCTTLWLSVLRMEGIGKRAGGLR